MQPRLRTTPAKLAERARKPGARKLQRGRALAAAIGFSLALGPALSPAVGQYTPPGSTAPVDDIPPQESFVERLAEARWDAGPVRLDPWLGISDAAYVSGLGGTEGDDFTVTAGAGLRAYLKTGPKIFWSAQALPEYVWWQDLEQKRRLNGSYGLGVFGYLNRLTFELSQRRIERQEYFSAEVQELTSSRQDTSRLAVGVELGSRIELFAYGRLQDVESLEEESAIFPLLDREAETLGLGLRYRSPGGLWVELAAEDLSNDFAQGARNLSSSGTSEHLRIGFQEPRWETRLDLASSSLDPEPGSELRPLDETTGSLELLWRPSRRLDLFAYARRSYQFSVDPSSSHFLGERRGMRLRLQSRVVTLDLYGELGDDEFEPLAGGPERLDDATAVGADLRIELRRLPSVLLRAVRTEYDSNLDDFDRETTSFGFTVELGAIVGRLRLGERGGAW